MKSREDKLQRMLHSLGRDLVKKISASAESSEAVRGLREEGYSLYLVLDRQKEGERRARFELIPRRKPRREPVFKLDPDDVTFLRSLGIDPTRRAKGRRM